MTVAHRFGALFEPDLQRIGELCKSIDMVILCTEDGFNVCSWGASDTQVNTLSAVVSSLMVLGENALVTLDASVPVNNLILESAASKIVVERVPHRNTRLFLMAKTDAAQLGVVLMAIRQGAVAIGKRLATHFPLSPTSASFNGDTKQ